MTMPTPEFDEGLSQRLPLPLAQLYRRAHDAKTASEHYLNAFYLWEAAIKLLTGGAVARYAALGERAPEIETQLVSAFGHPELQDWWDGGRMLVVRLAGGDDGFRALRDGLFNRAHDDLPHAAQLNSMLAEFAGGRRVARTSLRLVALIERLIEFRGREVGHQQAASARGDDFYTRWGPVLLAGATEVLGRVDVLAGRKLAFRGDSGLDGTRWLELTEHPHPLEERFYPAVDVEHRDCIYLLGAGREDLPAPLHPLALYDVTGAGFFFYQSGREGVDYTYLNYTTGELRQRAPQWFLNDLLAGTIPRPEASARADEPSEHTLVTGVVTEPSKRQKIGEFDLLGELGRGGVSVVYRAWQPSLGREVALKLFRSSGSPEADARVSREVRALVRVNHAHLVRIYTSGTDGGDSYYTMELLEGRNLAQTAEELRARYGRDALRRVVELVVQVAGALHALHEAKILHRDVKPTNVIVDPTGTQATLFDLSLARISRPDEATLTQLGAVLGTPRYMSPEQVRGGDVDRRTDVYSLGVTLWEALTLHRLYESRDGEGAFEMMRRTVDEAARPPSAVNHDIDPGLDAIVLKCLAKNPDDRYASAQALADGLRRWLAGEQFASAALELEESAALRTPEVPESIHGLPDPFEGPLPSPPATAPDIDLGAAHTGGVSDTQELMLSHDAPASGPSSLRWLVLLAVAGACGLAAAFLTSQMSLGPGIDIGWLATSGGWALAAVLAATTLWQWSRVRHLRAELERRAEAEPARLVTPDPNAGPSPAPIEHDPIPLAHPAEPSGSPDVPSQNPLFTFRCRFCNRRMGIPDTLLGTMVRCPHCKEVLLAPSKASGMLPAVPADMPSYSPQPPHPEPAPLVPAVPPVPPETTRPLVTVGRPKLRTGDEAFSSQTVVLRYPAPIAIAYRRFCARKEPPDRLAQLFSTFEITIKYLVYLAHSDLARLRVSAGPPYDPLPGYSGFDFTRRPVRMTLGQWLEALRTAADELAKRPDRFFAELPDVCRSGGSLDREIVQWIKTNRNVWAHIEDGQSLTTEECSRLLPEARPRLERLFQEIDFVRRYPLGFVTAGYPGSGDLVRYRVHSCMGARVAHGEEVYPMETTVRFPVGVPFVVHPDETAALCLWPFLLYRESDATQRPALYVFRGIEKDERFMAAVEAVAIDHKDTWSKRLHPTAAADHNWLWEALAKLPQTVAITPELRLADGLAESLVGRLTGESLGEKKHIKLIGPIARGGFGTVYDALDTQRNVRVAVKVLEDREGLDPKEDMAQFKRFQQEYEKLQRAGAATAGFVRTFEWGTSIIGRREYPWFSMEFAEGGDLSARLEERRTALQDKLPWNEPEAREAVVTEFRAVAGAVANLHDLGIVHRDVKPGNILVMDGGELRLSDFGLVKDLDRPRVGVSVGPGSTRGAVVGTRDYMAPEQERGETVTRAADVYSLGVLLAELTTGRRPLPSSGAVAGSPVERDERVLKLPEPLRRLISRCTDLDPESRPEDAERVLSEFEKILRKHG